jgi:hypothetical protein
VPVEGKRVHVPERRFVVEYRPAEGTECGGQNLDAIEIRPRAIEDAMQIVPEFIVSPSPKRRLQNRDLSVSQG